MARASSAPDVLEPLLAGDERALARAISWLERGDPRGAAVLASARAAEPKPSRPRPHIVGVTGSPGSGKSTLVDALISAARASGRRVAVVAVDPSSPYSGGAILGDRIRMTRWHDDAGVYIRSMATRGHLGGLAAATLQVVGLLEQLDFDLVLIETVGVGQSEVDIVRVADTTLLVLTPGAGDGVQAFKAGIMEIADAFVVNKADLPGAERLRREIRAALELAHPAPGAWVPPILLTTASKREGIEALAETIDEHRARLRRDEADGAAVRRRVRFEIGAALDAHVRRALRDAEDDLVEAVAAGRTDANAAVRAWLARVAAADAATGAASDVEARAAPTGDAGSRGGARAADGDE